MFRLPNSIKGWDLISQPGEKLEVFQAQGAPTFFLVMEKSTTALSMALFRYNPLSWTAPQIQAERRNTLIGILAGRPGEDSVFSHWKREAADKIRELVGKKDEEAKVE